MSDKRIDEIVAWLDGSITKGVGHLNVEVNGDSTEKTVETLGCIDCAKGNLACQVPTLHEGIDDAFDE